MKNANRFKPLLTPIALGLLTLIASMPASAETEIEALRREVAEQRLLIQKILASQDTKQVQERQAGASAPGPSSQAVAPAAPVAPVAPLLALYGIADVNVSYTDSGFGGKTNVGSGGMATSRLGVKGEKRLSENIKAIYLMEAGLSFSTGTVGMGTPTLGINNTVPSTGSLTSSATQLFSRQIYAGLVLPIGTITAGRQYSGSYLASVTEGSAMGAGLYGASSTFLPIIVNMPTRFNNSVAWVTPKFTGASAQLTLTSGSGNNVNTVAGTPNSSTTDQAGRGGDLVLSYVNGPFRAALTGWHVRNASFNPSLGETGLATKKGYQGGVTYGFRGARIYATYAQGKVSGGGYENGTKTLSDATSWSVSAGVPFAGGTILASYTRADDKSLLLGRDAELLGIAYTYKFLEATTLYGSWGKVLNSSNATYSLPNGGDLVGTVAAPGFNPTGFMVGLNHVF
jgi:predicted porin